ncbi:MAG: hypothetical protein MUD00_00675 [Candidatus Pacebacteria bacterium]|jgi:hypothetical protein|nr:hypothetical protein [Candidatus Paceibacterota bacterium]
MNRLKRKIKSGFKHFVLTLVLLGVTFASLFSSPLQVHAADSMQEVFPATSSSDSGVGDILPIGTVPYSGRDGDEYIINENNLSLTLEGTPTSQTVTFKMNLRLGGDSIQGINPGRNGNNTLYDEEEDLGSWQSIYDTNSDGSWPPTSDSGRGIWLDIGTSVAPGQASVGFGSPPIAPVINDLVQEYDLATLINFRYTSQEINITVGTAAGLTPNTQYYARIRVEESDSTDNAYSKIVGFKTGAAGDTGEQSEEITASLTQSEINNEGQLIDLLDCGISTIFTDCLVIGFYYLFYVPSSWILRAAGWLLDAFVTFSISTKVYSDPSFITEGWKIVRDIANIFFIFVLVYIAFKLILGVSGSDVKRMLTTIIIVGVLINFSLFFTKVVIDSSNILARIFYQQIQITGTEGRAITDASKLGVEEKSLSQAIVSGVSVNKMLSDETITKLRTMNWHSTSSTFLIIILGLIVNLVTAWTLFMSALFFIGRIVALWVAMIFSAFAFMSNIAPDWFKQIPMINWSSWFSDLLKVSFLAPIFLFFIYLIIAFVNSKFLDGLLLKANDFDFTQLLVSIMLQFGILIVLIQKAKDIAEKLAGDTAGAAVSAIKKGASAVGSVVAGAGLAVATAGAGFALRGTLGRYAADQMNSEEYKKKMAERIEKGGVRGWLAQRELKSYESFSNASFDARGSKRFQSALTRFGGATGININTGTGHEGGHLSDKEKKEKEHLAMVELLRSKKSDEEWMESLSEDDPEKKKYMDAKKKYETEKAVFDEYENKYREAYEAAKNLPGFNLDKFRIDYEKANGKAPDAPKEVKASDYVDVSKINKERELKYARYLRENTLRAKIERATGDGDLLGTERSAQLSAAKKIEREAAMTEKSSVSMSKLARAAEQAEYDIGRLNREIEAHQTKYSGTPEEVKQKITLEINTAKNELKDIDLNAEMMKQKYESVKKKGGNTARQAYIAWQAAEDKRKEKQEEIAALGRVTEDQKKRISELEKKEGDLEKLREKIDKLN